MIEYFSCKVWGHTSKEGIVSEGESLEECPQIVGTHLFSMEKKECPR